MAGKSKGNMSAIITVIAIVAIIILVMLFSFLQWAFLQSGTYSLTYKSGKEICSIEMQPFGSCVLTVGEEKLNCTWAPVDYNIFANTGAYSIKYNPDMDSAGVITIGSEEIEYTAENAANNEAIELFCIKRVSQEAKPRFEKA